MPPECDGMHMEVKAVIDPLLMVHLERGAAGADVMCRMPGDQAAHLLRHIADSLERQWAARNN